MINVSINGVPYSLFETINISRTIDDSTGTFSMSTSSVSPNDFPIKRGDQITISINNIPKLYGFVDEVMSRGDYQSHTIEIIGRDNTCDLIDSTVPNGSKNIEDDITLQGMCENVISNLGISMAVEDLSGQRNFFSFLDLQAAESGDGAMEYLQSYARKRQVFLIPSGDGRLIIYRPGAINATTELIHRYNNNLNNVKSFSVRQAQQGRHNQYTVVSQDNLGFDENANYSVEGMNRTGLVSDEGIRRGRSLEIVSEETMDDNECLERAKEEANVRRARSTSYTAVVAGAVQADGTPWDIGLRVNIRDEITGINGVFLIRSVNISQSVDQGTITQLTCAPIDAYKVQAVESLGDSRTSNSESFANQTPPRQARRPR